MRTSIWTRGRVTAILAPGQDRSAPCNGPTICGASWMMVSVPFKLAARTAQPRPASMGAAIAAVAAKPPRRPPPPVTARPIGPTSPPMLTRASRSVSVISGKRNGVREGCKIDRSRLPKLTCPLRSVACSRALSTVMPVTPGNRPFHPVSICNRLAKKSGCAGSPIAMSASTSRPTPTSSIR